MTKSSDSTEYRALAGMNYVSTKTGKECRAEEGDLILDMPPTSVNNEIKAGNLKVAVKGEKKSDLDLQSVREAKHLLDLTPIIELVPEGTNRPEPLVDIPVPDAPSPVSGPEDDIVVSTGYETTVVPSPEQNVAPVPEPSPYEGQTSLFDKDGE